MSMHGPALRRALDGAHHDTKQRFRTELTPDIVVRPYDQTMDQARQWTFESLKNYRRSATAKWACPKG
ncbi:hypothetical protein [Corynebacterium cystitidis]|uniref:hypothetical protein n=1 Tax=Corynebacterium cystitidis TaxID=35757 RepID=UPI00211DFB05|nr:hypothetical protein [Corynebacterium cystitidis]